MSLPAHIRIRCAAEHPLIFERPASQPKTARRAMILATGIGWTIWIYLWRPALTLLPWWFGADIVQHQWVELAGWTGLIDFAIHTMPYGWALCAALLLWASVNYIRFRGSNRRRARSTASVEDDAVWTRIAPAALADSRQLKNIVCGHDDEGLLIGVQRAPDEDDRRRRPAGEQSDPIKLAAEPPAKVPRAGIGHANAKPPGQHQPTPANFTHGAGVQATR